MYTNADTVCALRNDIHDEVVEGLWLQSPLQQLSNSTLRVADVLEVVTHRRVMLM